MTKKTRKKMADRKRKSRRRQREVVPPRKVKGADIVVVAEGGIFQKLYSDNKGNVYCSHCGLLSGDKNGKEEAG